jgi:hypothetical protein
MMQTGTPWMRTSSPSRSRRAVGTEREPEEILVRDPRGDRRPAEMVERKLLGMLRLALVPVSQIRLTPCGWNRSRR